MRIGAFKLAVVAALLTIAGLVVAAEDGIGTRWIATGSGKTYQVEGAGDPTSEQGARVSLASADGDESKFGAAATILEASRFLGHTVALSAELTTRNAGGGAGIWLRADGPQGSSAFRNTQDQLVFGNNPAAHREVEIDVPSGAVRLVFGTLLQANGEVIATQLRLLDRGVATIPPGVTPQSTIDAAIDIVRANALRSGDIDWSVVEPEIRAMTEGAKVPADVYPAIRKLLNSLGDHHSMFIDPKRSQAMQHAGQPNSDPVISLLSSGIGYIAMPGYNGTDPQAGAAFASQVNGAIGRISGDADCGWIVDLRDDTGGNMWPMLAALKPFLGDENLGSFAHNFGRSAAWRAGDQVDHSTAVSPDLSRASVAVLIGPKTASAGEAVAVAFRGRPNTRSFGDATAGLTNGNGRFPLPDGSVILLASVVELDRDEHAYTGKLKPDTAIAAAAPGSEDAVRVAAAGWLQQECGK